MRVLIVTDAFPPLAGGSGWSTHALARELRTRGHEIIVVRPRFESPAPEDATYDGFDVLQPQFRAPTVPFVRNFFRNERLYARLGRTLADVIQTHHIDVVHGQHLLSGPAAIRAAHQTGIVSVCTIRDYWPACYWSDLKLDPVSGEACPACSARQMITCLKSRGGRLWPLGLPAIPYMQANLRAKQQALGAADAVVAVSSRLADDLRARGPEFVAARIHVIPNSVDIDQLHREANPTAPLPEPYALYVGKLAHNKGSLQLVQAVRDARLDWPVVVVGDGPLRPVMEAAAKAAHLDMRFTGWASRPDVLTWLRHASMLVFPSAVAETLSRVLLEASALGVPIAAIDTGGTSEIVVDGTTGLLCQDVHGLAAAINRLRSDAELRLRLGSGAARRMREMFASAIVGARVESLYTELLRARR
jgi:glycogen(starch) synthase